MAARFSDSDGDFEARFAALLAAKREVAGDVDRDVRAIVDDVRARGVELPGAGGSGRTGEDHPAA